MPRFDLDDFVARCHAAALDTDGHAAVRQVLERVGADAAAVPEALGPPTTGNLDIVHHTAACTILHVVWTPGMRIEPHDHAMTASIVVYGGTEDNAFFRRLPDGTIERRGGQTLHAGDVCQLGPDMIHRVEADARRYTGALHVYNGDFFDRVRNTWSEQTGEPTDDPRPVDQLFADAEAAWRRN